MSSYLPNGIYARREFLKLTGAVAAGFALGRIPVAAGPFTREDFDRLVPADKKLRPDWMKSLFARGRHATYQWPESRLIGMPVGGICAGQVYLGGDGKLWHWDIFNQPNSTGTTGNHYVKPMQASCPFAQGFALRLTQDGREQTRTLDHTGWREVTFNGEYPIGHVEYRDPDSPIATSLEAFSPFIPLNVEDSSLPATVMRFKLTNGSRQMVEAELAGWLENAVALKSGEMQSILRHNRIVRQGKLTLLECSATPAPEETSRPLRPNILFDDFERETYAPWKAAGTAFGSGPVVQSKVMDYQGDLAMHGGYAVNTHAAAPGSDVGGRDAHTGTLTSPPFTIERDYVRFLIGGGAHEGKTCVNLLVAGEAVLSATGVNDNQMHPHSWDVRRWAGQTAQIQAVDNEKGPWGNIGLDFIVFSDQPAAPPGPLAEQPDFGTMTLALLGEEAKSAFTLAALPEAKVPEGVFLRSTADRANLATKPFGQKLAGSISRHLSLKPGQTGEVTFVLTWHFPNLKLSKLPPGRHYATRFASARVVAEYVAINFDRLASQTRLWHDTWYDSTLPYWFLDRTFLNTSILATSTCYRLSNGRFWGWEGVGCCEGTCGHVWQYAQAVARLFPQLERDTRERVDFGLAQKPDGAISFRAEHNNFPAVDAQAGTVLRALREHQMTSDDAWLMRNWPGIRQAIEWLIAKDGNGDGLIESNQQNTLDTDWFGPVAWLSGMYLAALRAGDELAREAGDEVFARRCRDIFERGQPKFVARLYNGEYFINQPDPKHLDAINSGTGCHIDQVFGQSWAWAVGLGRVLPEPETISALKSLWRYNFTPDVGPYREVYKPGRWYAIAGEGGLLMCTFPQRDWDYAQAKGKGADWAAGYFNECMNGFEYQVAGHMIWEGLLTEGLAVARMVHDRYHPARRNPWNEIECGDHYARSMASYGVYLAACGFGIHGPRARISFAPRLTPENFKCAFTGPEGWGSFSQKDEGNSRKVELNLRYGHLRLNSLALALAQNVVARNVRVNLNGRKVVVREAQNGTELVITFAATAALAAGDQLNVNIRQST